MDVTPLRPPPSALEKYMDDREELLRERGWSQWYNPNYWVHPKTIINPYVQDYTNYGMSLEEAYEFEVLDKPAFKPIAKCLQELTQKV